MSVSQSAKDNIVVSKQAAAVTPAWREAKLLQLSESVEADFT